MSQINKAKQRLMQKSNSILQANEDENDFKVFTRTDNLMSIPKLHISKQKSLTQMQLNQYDLSSPTMMPLKNSPEFPNTKRVNVLHRSERIQIMSQKAENGNLFMHKASKTRRTTEYQKPISMNYGIQDVSFTQNDKSTINNQSPYKTNRMNAVHSENLNLIISKPPIRRSISPYKPIQCQTQSLQKIMKQEKAKMNLFTDDMFPPRFTIVFNKKHMCLQEGFKMERLTKIYQGMQVRLIRNCEPTLFNPGKYTSPALYCALVILCQEPTRVLSLFGQQQYNQKGIYYVQLCKDGVWRHIIIDDFFPVKILAKRSLLYLHTLPRNNIYQIWPSLVQKAIAKIYGTYQDIYLTAQKGVKDILQLLTGYPVSEYDINKDFRTFLVLIDAAIKKNQIVVLEQVMFQYKQAAKNKQLYEDQSYQIIQVKKNYIVLRNIADNELTTKLTFEQAMIFSKLMIFRSQNNYVYISKTMRHKKGSYSLIKVKINSSIKCYWDVWQNNEVYYKNHIGSHIQYHKSKYTIKLKKQGLEDHTYDSVNKDYIITESGKETTMSPGNYDIMIHLCQDRQQDFTLSYYGEENIQLTRVKNQEMWPSECSC